MTLNCLASSSSGNCFVLTADDGKKLILDCGIPIKDIKIGLNFQLLDIAGCVVTHVHKDHSKSVNDLRKMGIKVYTPYEDVNTSYDRVFFPFRIKAFPLDNSEGHFVHSNADGSECPVYGFYITCRGENLIYITDCEFVKYRFKGINNLLLGINYADESFTENDNEMKKRHVMSGHLELHTACEFIRVTDRDKTLKKLIVCHLSGENANPKLFWKEIEKVTDADIYFATKGIQIDL